MTAVAALAEHRVRMSLYDGAGHGDNGRDLTAYVVVDVTTDGNVWLQDELNGSPTILTRSEARAVAGALLTAADAPATKTALLTATAGPGIARARLQELRDLAQCYSYGDDEDDNDV